MRKSLCSFDGIRIIYDIVRRKGRYIVFLHGAGGNLTAWKKIRSFFHRKGYSTLALDLRGHGKSGRPLSISDYRIEHFAQDLHAVIARERVRRFFLVGNCLGSMVATEYHRLFPEDASAYVLVGAADRAPKTLRIFVQLSPWLSGLVNRQLERRPAQRKRYHYANYDLFVDTNDWDFRRIYSDIVHTSLPSYLITYQQIAGFDGRNILRSMDKPVLIITGGKDSIVNVAHMQRMKVITPNARLVVLPHANHILVLNDPGGIQKEILGFIDSLGS